LRTKQIDVFPWYLRITFPCSSSGDILKKYKKLNETVREYNGVAARFTKDKSAENKALLDDVMSRLKEAANEVIID